MTTASIAAEPVRQFSVVDSIAHDLRNPIATIQGGAELLVNSILPETQVHRIARNMYHASVRMRELLEEFLEQSRTLNSGAESCDLHELVIRAVDNVAAMAELKAVQIVRVVPDGLAAWMDRHRIHRVLVNLLANAVEAVPHGGSIHISAVSDRNTVLIRVRDSGPGIAPEIKDRLFQPFVTAGKPNGVGLGLALSRQAVLDHGGDLWAEPTVQGACFVFRLPVAPGTQAF